MKTATIAELKIELAGIPQGDMLELCLRMARYKKENKELLTYLLFEQNHEAGFIDSIKKEMDDQFAELPLTNPYFLKKGLRRILRLLARYSKQSGIKETEMEIILHFCSNCQGSGISKMRYKAIENIYARQLDKLTKLASKVHEDLHYDYQRQIDQLKK